MIYPWQFGQGIGQLGQAQGMGAGLNQAAGILQNQNQYAQNMGNMAQLGQPGQAQNVYPPPPQFEENVPDDELEFEGKLIRWNPYSLLAQYSPGLNRKNHFGIECCQRCLMI